MKKKGRGADVGQSENVDQCESTDSHADTSVDLTVVRVSKYEGSRGIGLTHASDLMNQKYCPYMNRRTDPPTLYNCGAWSQHSPILQHDPKR
jgi:hypothetical protein